MLTDLIGCKIYHERYGYGYIESVKKGNYICVAFNTFHNKETLSSFIFPDAFIKGYLRVSDPAFAAIIEKESSRYICNCCKKTFSDTIFVDNYFYCQSCYENNFAKCYFCKKSYKKDQLLNIISDSDKKKKILLCESCAENESFLCEHCGQRYTLECKADNLVDQRIFCKECYSKIACKCVSCGKYYDRKNTQYVRIDYSTSKYDIRRDDNYCPTCTSKYLFKCTECNSYYLKKNYLAHSEYLDKNITICKRCVSKCNSCGIAIDEDHCEILFEKRYCPSCYNTKQKKCELCDTIFIPQDSKQTKCPNCENILNYLDSFQELELDQRDYKSIDYYSLKYTDKCSLFTTLHDNCRNFLHAQGNSATENLYQILLIKDLYWDYVIIGDARLYASLRPIYTDITMTKFLSTKGHNNIISATRGLRLNNFDNCVLTKAGKVEILSNPIVLRVQTQYDKIYGKEWDGPYGYTEIGNYGDTTNFYIIGIIRHA